MIAKSFIIVSPQPWNHIAISKHHYAMELANRGHQVLFLNPPATLDVPFVVHPTDHPNIRSVEYRQPWFYRTRFHWRGLYDVFMNRHIQNLVLQTGFHPDVAWCFDFNLFSDLKAFGARQSIFNPVDPLSAPHHTSFAKTADLVLTVSNTIAESIRPVRSDVRVIGHGLSAAFASHAQHRLSRLDSSIGSPIRVGYAGNLMRKPLNRAVLKRIVEDHPSIDFHFWGPYNTEHVDTEAGAFIRFLQACENVRLHGSIPPQQLADEIQSMDAFLLVYGLDEAESDRSNSHKLLEYLSTGKVVVSSRIGHYEGRSDLLQMPNSGDDDDIPDLFRTVIQQLDRHNEPQASRVRIEYALQHTYAHLVDQIESWLTPIGQHG